jgi:imidazolonepropionase-like amidohydrolase
MTVNPATIFELGPEHGTLAPESRADLVIWSGDPLEVTSVAEQVVIGGRPVPMVSRQTLLRDRYLPEDSRLPRAYIKP